MVLPPENVGSMVSEKGEEEEEAVTTKLVVASTVAMGGVDVFLHCEVEKGGVGKRWAAPASEEYPEGKVKLATRACVSS